MFANYINKLNDNNKNCKKFKLKLNPSTARQIFIFLDLDESGKLKQEEIVNVLQDRQLLG